jgi:Protein ENHANCED DISEASE RESISTANCE 2, C-terminal
MLKMIPHIGEGSWVIKQSVGARPFLLGRKLKTQYTITDRYVEVDIDVSADTTAAYFTGMVSHRAGQDWNCH